MVKRLLQFQFILAASMNQNPGRKVPKAFLLLFLLPLVFLFTPARIVLGSGSILLYIFLSLSIYLLNQVLYSKNGTDVKVYGQIPVSRKYLIGNLLLLPLLFIIFCILLSFTMVMVVELVGLIFGGTPDLNFVLDWWKFMNFTVPANMAGRFILYYYGISYLVFVIITFVRNKKIRWIGYAAFIAASLALLSVLDYYLPKMQRADGIYFRENFSEMKNAEFILQIMSILFVLLVPVSIVLSYRLYFGKHK